MKKILIILSLCVPILGGCKNKSTIENHSETDYPVIYLENKNNDSTMEKEKLDTTIREFVKKL